jgi:molybdopterin-biosynthesis enzyme MoeA-like protein
LSRFLLTGSSHDDITYQSIAKGFGLPLKLHAEAFEKMKRLSKRHPSQPKFDWDTDSPALKAKLRMVELPTDESRDTSKQFLFPHDDLWVPIAVVNGNVHILPGVPRLCKSATKKRLSESVDVNYSSSL